MRVTLKEVAKKAGVSITAVSFVLNGRTSEVSPQTARKILKTIEELNYVPDMRAKQLKLGKSKLIALMVPDIGNPFFTMIAEHSLQVLRDNEYTLALMRYRDSDVQDFENANLLLTNAFDGSLIVSSDLQKLKPIIDSPNIAPFILLDESPTDDYYSVTGNNYGGGYLVAQYLYSKGHRRFACLAGPESASNSGMRLKGFKDYLSSKSITIDESLTSKGDYTFESGYQRAQKLIEKREEFTALFCANDLIAFGALKAFTEANISIPDDLSVMGYDNIRNYTNYELDTVDQQIGQISDVSVNLLLDLINKKQVKQKKIVIDPIIVTGKTVKDIN